MNKSLECGPSVTVGLALVLRLNVQLGYTDVLLKGQESDKNLLPKPERGIFIHLMDLAKPNLGMCTAFFTIGLAYELLNESDYAIRCFRDVFGAKPLIEIDLLSRVTAGVYLAHDLLLKDNDDQKRFEVAQEWSRQFLNTVMIDDKRGMIRRSRVFSPSWPEIYFYVFHFL